MDIDVDLASAVDPIKIIPGAVRASIYKDQKLTPHPCGVYLQNIPKDPKTGLAAIPYDQTDEVWFKLDLLHVRVYDHFSTRSEIVELIKYDPDWTLLQIPSVVEQLFHLGKHHDLLTEVKPRSILEVADCLALIRPQKKFLLKYYLADRNKYRAELYRQDEHSGYSFKKAHALAYALVIVLQLHLIQAGVKL